MTDTCKTCKFWKPPSSFYTPGECRRRAPQPTPLTGTYSEFSYEHGKHLATRTVVVAQWPTVAETDHCGEHEEKTCSCS